jgi:alpha-D-ribose 1-methylphosphonate 5-triphosphate synthase subunit PhnH
MFAAGFADPVHQAQQAFRAILEALSRPGTTQNLPQITSPEVSIPGDLVSTLLTLTDHDTPIWLSPSLAIETTHRYVGFHTGAPIITDMAKAMFAFIGGNDPIPPLSAFHAGTQEYPDRSTTIVLSLPALKGGPELRLEGPGIEHHRHIGPQGLPDDFVAQWAMNQVLFPRGIDMLLVSYGTVMGLPRTVRIGEGH